MRSRRPSLTSRYSCSSCALGLLLRHAGLQADNRLEPAVAALVHGVAAHHLLLHRHRYPRSRGHAEERSDKPFGCDADDRDRGVVDGDLLADDRQVAGEAPLPVGIAQHRDRMAARRDVVLRGEEAARRRPDAHDVEVIAADHAAPGSLGGVVHRNVEGAIILRDDVHHPGAIAEVDEVRVGPRSALPFAVLHRGDADRRRIGGERNRPEQDRLHPGEDRRVGADAEAERQDRRQRQPWILQQRPEGIAKIGDQCGHVSP